MPRYCYDLSSLPCARQRRILTIAAAGGHSLLAVGGPGVALTMFARRLDGLLPDLGKDRARAAQAVRLGCGLLQLGEDGSPPPLDRTPPLRAPHYTCSSEGMLGSFRPAREARPGSSRSRGRCRTVAVEAAPERLCPGEVTLADGGVLLLDEATEFARACLAGVAYAAERGRIELWAGGATRELAADPIVCALSQPCPCGRRLGGSEAEACGCSAERVARYVDRLRPLLSHAAIVVALGPEVEGPRATSAVIRRDVERVRALQAARPARMRAPDHEGHVRAIAQTIADLGGRELPSPEDYEEARGLRELDRVGLGLPRVEGDA
jgi:magnesium chelatase family protein